MKLPNKPIKNAGFSLLEISITLTIIALLAAAVLTGQRMKHRQELNQIISDISNITSAVAQFEETFGSLPGDILNATDVLSAGTSNGNGDEDLDTGTPNEELFFWQHLQLAGLISGTYDGVTSGKGGAMDSSLNYGFYFAKKASGGRLNIQVSKAGSYGLLSAKEAYDIDVKYDDSNPEFTDPATSTASIRAANGTGEAATACITTSSSPDVYTLATVTGTPCVIFFYLE